MKTHYKNAIHSSPLPNQTLTKSGNLFCTVILSETLPFAKRTAKCSRRTPAIFQSLALVALFAFTSTAPAQTDWIRTGTGLGVEKVRLAAANFKLSTNDPRNAALLTSFNDTLESDLENAGIFDMVSKSFHPSSIPGSPPEVKFLEWSAPPPNASMLAFGSLGATAGGLTVQGWLDDVKNPLSA